MSCLTVGAVLAGAQQPAAARAAIDPKATNALRQMGGYLRSLKEFGVRAEGTRDEVLADGEKIQFGGTVSYLVRAPNGLRAEVNTDRKQRTIFYDGKTLTVFAPRMHFYATAPAPNTIGAMIDTARWRFKIDFPLADLFLWGTSRDGMKDITSARYIGPAYVNGTDTDHYAFRQEDADWQIWIERGTHLPRKVVITTKTLAEEPEYAALLTWDLHPSISDSTFTFVPPQDAKRITLMPALARPQQIAKEKK